MSAPTSTMCEGRRYLTTNNIHNNHPHPQIINPHPPIHTPRHDFVPHNTQTAHTILRLLKHLDRFRALALTIPQSDRSIETPTDNHTAPFPSKPHTIDPPKMPGPPPQRPRSSHIPQKDLLIPSDGREARVVVCDCYIEDFVAVGGVGLDEAGGWYP